MTDLEINQNTFVDFIEDVVDKMGVDPDLYEPYGRYMAKLDPNIANAGVDDGNLILVTSMSPTKSGNGKTTVSIALADGLTKLGKETICCLRQASLGPVFGLKGACFGGGRAQLAPADKISLHFTGDFHAITAAHNLLAAMIDNHIYQGNDLGIAKVTWKRVTDTNDRDLRSIITGVGGNIKESGFDITAASEVMAAFCLAASLDELKYRLGSIIVGYTAKGLPVLAHELKADGAMTALLKDAFSPNLVQTLEGTPAIVHGGPFANIAHGCNSLIATKIGLKLASYVVTEAGFGADLGAEKFFDIKCRVGELKPKCVVMVVTTEAIKTHGFENVYKHYENMRDIYNMPVVIALNRFAHDTDESIAELLTKLPNSVECTGWANGGDEKLAQKVLDSIDDAELKFAYSLTDSTEEKITKVATKIYGAAKVEFSKKAQKALSFCDRRNYPICIAKTQYSLSDDQKAYGVPKDHTLHVKDIKLCEGSQLIVVYCGDIMTLPALPKHPAAENIDVINNKIIGIF